MINAPIAFQVRPGGKKTLNVHLPIYGLDELIGPFHLILAE